MREYNAEIWQQIDFHSAGVIAGKGCGSLTGKSVENQAERILGPESTVRKKTERLSIRERKRKQLPVNRFQKKSF
jgi:hypothetical protein